MGMGHSMRAWDLCVVLFWLFYFFINKCFGGVAVGRNFNVTQTVTATFCES